MGWVGGFHSLPMAQCDDGQDGGFGRCFWCVCVVPCWVGVTPTCINELLWRLMLAFRSPLALWPWCPPLFPPSFSHAVNITYAGGYSLIYIPSRKHACLTLLRCSVDDEMKKNVHLSLFFMLCVRMGKVEPEYDYGSLCVGMHMHMYADRMTIILTVGTVNETYSWHEKDNYSSSSPHVYFLCVFFFPHLFAKSPHTPEKNSFCSGSQHGLPNAQLLSSVSSPVSRYANFLWWSEGSRDKSGAL